MFNYSFSTRILFFLRDLRSQRLYEILNTHCSGNVLDIGGASFYVTAKRKGVRADSWTCVESSESTRPDISDSKFKFIIADGCALPFPDACFDTVINIQVLEHTFEPFKMFQEAVRVLKPTGKAIFFIPQTGTIHLAPHHYQNFTRFWIEEAARRTNLRIVALENFGGWWSSIASRGFYFFLSAFRRPGNFITGSKRSWRFYVLLPLMAFTAIFSIPVALFLALGDFEEEAPNYLLVAQRD